MTDALAHRGPDDSGAWIDSAAGIALGHRRLSIVDLSPHGHQPMHSACGRYTITFNGEIYNFKSLRRELETHGHHFRGHSDTEVLLAAVREWGLNVALTRFNGMFAFAVWDHTRETLHLVRDRAGEKPLYYARTGDGWLFASELKALRAHDGFRPEIDRNALALYLRQSFIPSPYSIYEGVRKLLPGAVLSISRQNWREDIEPVEYWSARDVCTAGTASPFVGGVEAAGDELDSLLRDAVQLRMEADVPLGAFLSGGIDSSLIVALMQAQSARPVRTFTIGFHDRDFNEAEHAKAVARHLGTEHTELYVSPAEAVAVIPRLPDLYDEPFSDTSQIPTYLVAELARHHVTVSLSGDAGDELFGGYTRYLRTARLWELMRRVPRGVRRALATTVVRPLGWASSTLLQQGGTVRSRAGGARMNRRVRQIAELLPVRRAEEVYARVLFGEEDSTSLVQGAYAVPTAVMDPTHWRLLPDFTQGMMYVDMITYLPDDILVKLDRATMGVSLEGRIPFLDHRVIEFAWRLPLSMKVRGGVGKWLLREVLRRYVPRELVERPKRGFSAPVTRWLRGPLRAWAEDLLDEARLRRQGILDPASVRHRWEALLDGSSQWESSVWSLLMFQAWFEAHGSGVRNIPTAVAHSA
jgi:asparagine synthase (glutamine-hydrolysing)